MEPCTLNQSHLWMDGELIMDSGEGGAKIGVTNKAAQRTSVTRVSPALRIGKRTNSGEE